MRAVGADCSGPVGCLAPVSGVTSRTRDPGLPRVPRCRGCRAPSRPHSLGGCVKSAGQMQLTWEYKQLIIYFFPQQTCSWRCLGRGLGVPEPPACPSQYRTKGGHFHGGHRPAPRTVRPGWSPGREHSAPAGLCRSAGRGPVFWAQTRFPNFSFMTRNKSGQSCDGAPGPAPRVAVSREWVEVSADEGVVWG